MLELIRHRGPDAFGIYTDKNAGLGSARLSIIDLSGGDQPIHNEDQSVWVVYNGEVFNYPELREDLESKGHRFYTHTDTEVLVHLYEEFGTDFFQKLNGQFAFTLWDKQKEMLLLGRDRLGVRPLFYYTQHGRLVFGSEIKTILADPGIPRSLDLQTLSDIFTCWTPVGSLTPFKEIRQIPPGHYAIFSRKGFETHRYWQLSFPYSTNSTHLTHLTEELKELLYDAIKIRLRADVPVGAYLSGGLDSTYITSLVKRFFNNRLCTFSVSFTDSRFDEASFQEKAVQTLGTDHRVIRCTEKEIGGVFPQVIWHTETPILRTAPAPMFLLSKLVRENNFKVVLTGEGSDEIFAGYDIFKEDRVRRFWARQPLSKVRPKLFQRLYPDIFQKEDSRSQAFLESFFRKGLLNLGHPAYSHLIRWENTGQLKTFFSDDLQKKIEKDDPFVDRFISTLPADFMRWDPLSRAQYTEISIFLSNYLLSSQGDRMGMGHSVEGRFPYLDHRVVEFACRVPPKYRLNGLKEKFILRESAKDLIPPELAQRPKQPYRAPISRCFLGDDSPDYVEELLSERAIRETGYFHPSRVAMLLQKCRRQEGHLLSERENMALIGILSTQLLDHLFIKNFPSEPSQRPEHARVFKQ
jgi:asparagine synthase (glutamine-hydrolysing)